MEAEKGSLHESHGIFQLLLCRRQGTEKGFFHASDSASQTDLQLSESKGERRRAQTDSFQKAARRRPTIILPSLASRACAPSKAPRQIPFTIASL